MDIEIKTVSIDELLNKPKMEKSKEIEQYLEDEFMQANAKLLLTR